MEPLRLAAIGCGGMGQRHLAGLAELHRAGLSPFELVAVCDPVADNAAALAAKAEEHFGRAPACTADLDQLAEHDIHVVDVTTSTRHHHTTVVGALERGWHVMVEKPIAVSMAAARLIATAAAAAGRVVSVAENYRRDPMNRLARALIEGGAIGDLRVYEQQSIGGADAMFISVWRHQKVEGGLLIDAGVHDTDMMEYLCGPVTEVYAQARLHEGQRINRAAGSGAGARIDPTGVYARWQQQMPANFVATAEDAVYGSLRFASGAVGHYMADHAEHGLPVWRRRAYGARGAIELPHDRRGDELVVDLDGQVHQGAAALALAPDLVLEPVTAQLFGGERLAGYELPFPEIDRKLIAVEYAELGRAVTDGAPVEVDLQQGMRATALAYALLESATAGTPVLVDDVMSGAVREYQRSIDEAIGVE